MPICTSPEPICFDPDSEFDVSSLGDYCEVSVTMPEFAIVGTENMDRLVEMEEQEEGAGQEDGTASSSAIAKLGDKSLLDELLALPLKTLYTDATISLSLCEVYKTYWELKDLAIELEVDRSKRSLSDPHRSSPFFEPGNGRKGSLAARRAFSLNAQSKELESCRDQRLQQRLDSLSVARDRLEDALDSVPPADILWRTGCDLISIADCTTVGSGGCYTCWHILGAS